MTKRTSDAMVPDTAQGEFAAHWRVVAASSVGMGVGLTMFSLVQSLFVNPMQAEFGWSRGDIANATGAVFLGALSAPLVGQAIDRLGVRRVVFASMLGTALGFVALAMIAPAIWTYYAAFAFLVVMGAGTTPISFSRAVSTWFDKGLGLALAITLSGVSLSAFLLPPILAYVIADLGWRAGYLLLAALPLTIGLPISWLWLVERRTKAPGERTCSVGLSARAALADRRFWILGLAVTLVTMPAISLASQLAPLLTDKGFSASIAAQLLSVFAVAVLGGRLVVGWFIDRYWAPGVAAVTLAVTSGGAFMLVGPAHDFWWTTAAVALLGIAQGAEINLIGFLIARYFGMRAFSSIYGNLNVVFGFSIAAGAVLFGHLYDLYGNYDAVLQIAGGSLLASAMTFPLLGRYPDWPEQILTNADNCPTKIGSEADS